ncbi:MAG: hypothetical protein LQ340_003438 [Diploschistes diacapsis]|nr:MAG: hypothetical protein LQ340_003438 [Diploschistes diacapsis]
MDNPPRPRITREHSKVPGGFDTDDEHSPTKSSYDEVDFGVQEEQIDPRAFNGSSSPQEHHDKQQQEGFGNNGAILDEGEMNRQLLDVESSFLPNPSPQTLKDVKTSQNFQPGTSFIQESSSIADTPNSSYKTPGTTKNSFDLEESATGDHANTSSLETMSSSPTAAAAARTVSRVVSMASMDGYETAVEGGFTDINRNENPLEGEPTPNKARDEEAQNSDDYSPTPRTSPSRDPSTKSTVASLQLNPKTPKGSRRRPKYLSSRHASQRSSYSSNTTSASAEGSNDLGAEYALQTGGGTPLGSSSTSRPADALSRSISLGSMASGISRLDEDEEISRGVANTSFDLHPLLEEGSPQSSILTSRQDSARDVGPQTPRASTMTPETLTDTVINQHVRNLEIPGTVARNFLSNDGTERSESPGKRSSLVTPSVGRVKNLTLKEQSGLIDRLQKENWKLKLKVYFMDQMLNERSDEAVKAMISENVELKTFKFSATKEVRGQKRLIKELEAKLRERDERLASQASTIQSNLRQSSYTGHSQQSFELESEVTYLREKVESYQVDLERLRADNAVKEGEKRRLAEMVRSAGDRSNLGSDIETREEVAVWKDLLEAETGRREQTEDENRRLQEELWRLKAEGMSSASAHHSYLPPSRIGKYSTPSAADSGTNGISKSSSTLVEHLRQENTELRRDLGAQASMLTSRNREKEKLYQEIEELKIGQRRDGRRSVGDSVLERSISRAHGRTASRASSQSRVTPIEDAERDAYETANGELRDRVAELKLENQELADHLDNVLDELENLTKTQEDLDKLKQMYEDLTEQTNQEVLGMQSERDEALQLHEESEQSFQDLRAEAQERINALEDELDQNSETIKQLEQELAQRDEESKALRNEVRMTSEGLDKVEADVQAKIRRIKELELENEDINRELENIENSLIEANGKSEKLSIELESRQSECAFLREEQDGFVLKIGDLEGALKGAQASLKSEKDRTKDLDARLAEERHQREVIGSKEKQEVQKIINDLNREATGAKDEARGLKKDLETREGEVAAWKERLAELEEGLQEVLGEKKGSKANYIFAISEIQRNLEETIMELSTTRTSLSEKDRILKKRDALLESHGLESRKLSELLEKERSARRADMAQQEQWQRTSQHSSRTISQKDSRIAELESSHQTDRKRLATLEQQFKDQLTDRNKLLLELWNKLSVLCGDDWVNQNSLVNNHLPTVDVVSNMLPPFQKNLLQAVKTIEAVVSNFPRRVKNVENALIKDYQQLEHNLDLRIRRLDRLESSIQQGRVSGVANAAPEIAKLRGENRLLKSEVAELHKQALIRQSRNNAVSIESVGSGSSPGTGSKDGSSKVARAAAASSLTRHYSATAVDTLQRDQQNGRPPSESHTVQSQPLEPSQARWIHRLKDLERRLKAEREARLQDRKGARERLEEGRAENEELKRELEREKEKNSEK